MSLQRSIVKCLFYFDYKYFQLAAIYSNFFQKKAWRKIKKNLSKGSFWNTIIANFHDKEIEYFPITDYEYYRTSISNFFHTDTSQFNNEKILFWCKSAGTTGTPKLYPITKKFQREFQLVNKPFAYYLHSISKKIFKNKLLYFAGSLPSEKSPIGIDVGLISAYNYSHIPSLFKKKYALPNEVFRDREIFFKWAPLYALANDISVFIAITPSIIERFLLEITKNRSFYIQQINHPKVPENLPPVIFTKDRIHFLKNALEQEVITIALLWPNFELLVCWKTATCGMQLKNLTPYIKDIKVQDAIYSATEGWMTVPQSLGSNGGALHLGGHVYEFIEYGLEIKPENLIKPWELTIGKKYEIFLTTSMGFIRYRLYDIIICNGYFHRSPVIEFVQKEGNAISIGQSRIAEFHITSAINLSNLHLTCKWVIAPSSNGKNLVLLVEDIAHITTRDVEDLENALRQCSTDYEKDRHFGMLEKLEMKKIPANHSIWQNQTHAQEKPRILINTPVD